MGGATSDPVRLSFNPQLRVELRGATATSDASLLVPRELDERLGLGALIEQHLVDRRTGHNRQFPLSDRAARPVGQLVNTSHHVNDSHPAEPWRDGRLGGRRHWGGNRSISKIQDKRRTQWCT